MNDPAAVINALENAPAVIVPLVREVPREVLKRRPAQGRWSAHEHACHLADVHALFFARLFRHLALHHFLHAYRVEELLLKRDWNDEA
ncbi:MAG: hypothetical protein QOH49_352 [Acidobacteriota bacterium]|jgi:hypothetical protein|nr:hypothetical protein [Acidobacteriota bacterium]